MYPFQKFLCGGVFFLLGKGIQPLDFLPLIILLIPRKREELPDVPNLVLWLELYIKEADTDSADYLRNVAPVRLLICLPGHHGLPELARAHQIKLLAAKAEAGDGPAPDQAQGQPQLCSCSPSFFFAGSSSTIAWDCPE